MTGAAVWWISVGFSAVGAAVIWLIVWSDLRYPREEIPPATNSPTAARRARSKPPTPRPAHAAAFDVAQLAHSAYATEPSVPEAHKIMQTHLDCSARDCERKRQALGILAATGKVVPHTQPRARLAGAPTDVFPVVRTPRG